MDARVHTHTYMDEHTRAYTHTRISLHAHTNKHPPTHTHTHYSTGVGELITICSKLAKYHQSPATE